MQGLTNNEISALLAPRASRKTPTGSSRGGKRNKGKIFVHGQWLPLTSKEDLGTFVGKQGTTKRSRKGRTYIAPNGSRRYVSWNPYEVQAYKIG